MRWKPKTAPDVLSGGATRPGHLCGHRLGASHAPLSFAAASCEPHRIDRRQRMRHAGPAVALVLAYPETPGRGAEGEPVAGDVERERMAIDHIVGVRLRQAFC